MRRINSFLSLLIVLCTAACSTKVPEPPPAPPALDRTEPKLPAPEETVLSTQHGIASWYSIKTTYGTKTASGRPLKNNAYTAAHKKLPLGSKVRVTNLRNGKSEILTISDRGPYIKGRVIDVTIGSAKRLGFYKRGLTKVKVELLEKGKWRYRKPR